MSAHVDTPLAAPFIGISRHRIGIDGEGVTTLACFHGCPLRCQYCLNSHCLDHEEKYPVFTPEELYNRLAIDNLYFIATHGGVCFGGGEPLLRVDFIEQFRQLCGRDWAITIETSLNVPAQSIERIAPIADAFIVDIKDCNPAIYKAYTGRDNTQVLENLSRLLELVGPDHIIVRIPSIPEYNTPDDTARTLAQLTTMGITRTDQFTYTLRNHSAHTHPDQ